MTSDLRWHVVRTAALLLPFVGTLLILVALPRPRSFRWRAVIAILATLVAWVVFTTEVYNPIGIAHAYGGTSRHVIRLSALIGIPPFAVANEGVVTRLSGSAR
jgi:hypothetical protein